MADTYNVSLIENLITVLAYDDEAGKTVAQMLNSNLLEGDYRLIADRCVLYWRQYGEAPKDHTADLVADVIHDKGNRRAPGTKRILQAMIALSESINTTYVMNQLFTFNRMQRIKQAIITSAEKINNEQHQAIGEIEDVWNALLRTRDVEFQTGTKLHDSARILESLAKRQSEFRLGVAEFDQRNIGPVRGHLLTLLGSAGAGKTWGCVHIGAQALDDRKKVLHLSLEMDEDEIAVRYYMRLFGVTTRDSEVEVTEFDVDDDELMGFTRKTIKPDFTLSDGLANDELITRMGAYTGRYNNLIIKRFAPNNLTPNGIRAYLDTLESVEGFVPDLVIVDYLGILKKDIRAIKESIGDNCLELRAIAIERNVAMVTAHQGNRDGANSHTLKTTHVGEDWSVIQTSDIVVLYSATDRETRHGLARLGAGKVRGEAGKFSVLITQSYHIGQWVMESRMMTPRYFDYLDDFAGDDADTPEHGGDEHAAT